MRRETQVAYAQWLSQYDWRFFVTLTFKERSKKWNPDRSRMALGMHPEEAHKRFKRLVSTLNTFLFGYRYYKYPGNGMRWLLAQETHRSGRIHFHSLMGDDGGFQKRRDGIRQLSLSPALAESRFLDKATSFWDHYGFSRFDPIGNQHKAVIDYVTKYVVKDGLLTFSRQLAQNDLPVRDKG